MIRNKRFACQNPRFTGQPQDTCQKCKISLYTLDILCLAYGNASGRARRTHSRASSTAQVLKIEDKSSYARYSSFSIGKREGAGKPRTFASELQNTSINAMARKTHIYRFLQETSVYNGNLSFNMWSLVNGQAARVASELRIKVVENEIARGAHNLQSSCRRLSLPPAVFVFH